MNIAFLTTVPITDIKRHGIYSDLVRMLVEKGNSVSIFFQLKREMQERLDLPVVRTVGLNISALKLEI